MFAIYCISWSSRFWRCVFRDYLVAKCEVYQHRDDSCLNWPREAWCSHPTVSKWRPVRCAWLAASAGARTSHADSVALHLAPDELLRCSLGWRSCASPADGR